MKLTCSFLSSPRDSPSKYARDSKHSRSSRCTCRDCDEVQEERYQKSWHTTAAILLIYLQQWTGKDPATSQLVTTITIRSHCDMLWGTPDLKRHNSAELFAVPRAQQTTRSWRSPSMMLWELSDFSSIASKRNQCACTAALAVVQYLVESKILQKVLSQKKMCSSFC